MRALTPDVAIVHLQRADCEGNAHCWGNFGVMIEGVRAAKRVIVVAEEIVDAEVIASDPESHCDSGISGQTQWSSAAMERIPRRCRDTTGATTLSFGNIMSRRKLRLTATLGCNAGYTGFADRQAYMNQLGGCRVEDLGVRQHAYAAQTDFGY